MTLSTDAGASAAGLMRGPSSRPTSSTIVESPGRLKLNCREHGRRAPGSRSSLRLCTGQPDDDAIRASSRAGSRVLELEDRPNPRTAPREPQVETNTHGESGDRATQAADVSRVRPGSLRRDVRRSRGHEVPRTGTDEPRGSVAEHGDGPRALEASRLRALGGGRAGRRRADRPRRLLAARRLARNGDRLDPPTRLLGAGLRHRGRPSGPATSPWASWGSRTSSA